MRPLQRKRRLKKEAEAEDGVEATEGDGGNSRGEGEMVEVENQAEVSRDA